MPRSLVKHTFGCVWMGHEGVIQGATAFCLGFFLCSLILGWHEVSSFALLCLTTTMFLSQSKMIMKPESN